MGEIGNSTAVGEKDSQTVFVRDAIGEATCVDGAWTQLPLQCHPDCPPLRLERDYAVLGGSTQVGSVAQVTCATKFSDRLLLRCASDRWKVVHTNGATRYSVKNVMTAKFLGVSPQGHILNGIQEGGWINLVDEDGYMIVRSGGADVLEPVGLWLLESMLPPLSQTGSEKLNLSGVNPHVDDNSSRLAYATVLDGTRFDVDSVPLDCSVPSPGLWIKLSFGERALLVLMTIVCLVSLLGALFLTALRRLSLAPDDADAAEQQGCAGSDEELDDEEEFEEMEDDDEDEEGQQSQEDEAGEELIKTESVESLLEHGRHVPGAWEPHSGCISSLAQSTRCAGREAGRRAQIVAAGVGRRGVLREVASSGDEQSPPQQQDQQDQQTGEGGSGGDICMGERCRLGTPTRATHLCFPCNHLCLCLPCAEELMLEISSADDGPSARCPACQQPASVVIDAQPSAAFTPPTRGGGARARLAVSAAGRAAAASLQTAWHGVRQEMSARPVSRAADGGDSIAATTVDRLSAEVVGRVGTLSSENGPPPHPRQVELAD